MFACKACQAKEDHISTLRSEVENLRKLVFPKNAENHVTVMEADAVLSNSDIPDYHNIQEDKKEELLKAQEEALKILTGDFAEIP